jgi:hypothetical protein
MSAQFVSILVLLAGAVGFLVGHTTGRKRGRDEQWVDDYFARIARERSRPRDRDGRYVAIKGREAAS